MYLSHFWNYITFFFLILKTFFVFGIFELFIYQSSEIDCAEKKLKVQKEEEESAKPKPVETKKVCHQGARYQAASSLFILLVFPVQIDATI